MKALNKIFNVLYYITFSWGGIFIQAALYTILIGMKYDSYLLSCGDEGGIYFFIFIGFLGLLIFSMILIRRLFVTTLYNDYEGRWHFDKKKLIFNTLQERINALRKTIITYDSGQLIKLWEIICKDILKADDISLKHSPLELLSSETIKTIAKRITNIPGELKGSFDLYYRSCATIEFDDKPPLQLVHLPTHINYEWEKSWCKGYYRKISLFLHDMNQTFRSMYKEGDNINTIYKFDQRLATTSNCYNEYALKFGTIIQKISNEDAKHLMKLHKEALKIVEENKTNVNLGKHIAKYVK